MNSRIGILGAGMMGTAIAAAHLRRGLPVLLFDTVESALESASGRIAGELRLQDAAFDASRVQVSRCIDDMIDCPILIETITEKLRAKHKLYRAIRNIFSEKDLPFLFTNTSTISISSLAEGLDPIWREAFCGFHVFHPVRKNSLVEIIPGGETAPRTVEVACRHATRIDKRPITVGDGPGFLVNRLLNAYLTSALILLDEGIDMQRIERLATNFGMRMGPFRIMDEIGLDVVMHAGWVLYKAFPDRVPVSPLLLKLVEMGRLGRKTGRGFMLYPNSTSWDGCGRIDPELPLAELSRERKPTHSQRDVSDEEILHRLFVSMFDEALRCRDEGVIPDLADADLASVHALGFPSEKGGIVHWRQRAEC